MRTAPIIATLIALFLIATSLYALGRGIYVGTRAEVRMRGNGEAAYFHKCRYLYLSGVHEVIGARVVFETSQEAESQFCPPLEH